MSFFDVCGNGLQYRYHLILIVERGVGVECVVDRITSFVFFVRGHDNSYERLSVHKFFNEFSHRGVHQGVDAFPFHGWSPSRLLGSRRRELARLKAEGLEFGCSLLYAEDRAHAFIEEVILTM